MKAEIFTASDKLDDVDYLAGQAMKNRSAAEPRARRLGAGLITFGRRNTGLCECWETQLLIYPLGAVNVEQRGDAPMWWAGADRGRHDARAAGMLLLCLGYDIWGTQGTILGGWASTLNDSKEIDQALVDEIRSLKWFH